MGPAYSAATIRELIQRHTWKTTRLATLATAVLDDPTGYGAIWAWTTTDGFAASSCSMPTLTDGNSVRFASESELLLLPRRDLLPALEPTAAARQCQAGARHHRHTGDFRARPANGGAITAVLARGHLAASNSRRELAQVNGIIARTRVLRRLMDDGRDDLLDTGDDTWIDARATFGPDTTI